MPEHTRREAATQSHAERSGAGPVSSPAGPMHFALTPQGRWSSSARQPPDLRQIVALRASIGNRAVQRAVASAQRHMIMREFVEYDPKSGRLPALTAESGVAKPNDDDTYVTLARGCHSEEQREAIVKNETAGGVPAGGNVERPTEKTAVDYVSLEVFPGKTGDEHAKARREHGEKLGVVEWTTRPDIALNFGRPRGGIVIARIQKRFLIKGSGTEGGWLVRREAPIDGLVFIRPIKPAAEPQEAQKRTLPSRVGAPPPSSSPSSSSSSSPSSSSSSSAPKD